MPGGISAYDFYERGLALKKVQIFDMAVREFHEATKDPQQAGKAFAQIALCLKRLRRDGEAVAAFREALATDSFSAIERAHMQHMLARTLESLGRQGEALIEYRAIRRAYPNFQGVDGRIQYLTAHVRASSQRMTAQENINGTIRWSHLKPQLTSLLAQTWQRLTHSGQRSDDVRQRGDRSLPVEESHNVQSQGTRSDGITPRERSVCDHGAPERRGHRRVTVQMLSQFFSKAHTVAGEGEVRDLSPSGCRIASPVRVAQGTAVECWIYPEDDQPFAVDEATVQWVGHRQFGLRFKNIRIRVQRQITGVLKMTA